VPAVRHFLDAIRFEHTVFALPFAYVAMVLAADGWPGWRVLIWVTLAMVGARTLAMSVNRLADRFIDAANPRPPAALPPGSSRRAGDRPPCLGRALLLGVMPNRLPAGPIALSS
jgi:4-hydroxybenzoate polyprenyltransferase